MNERLVWQVVILVGIGAAAATIMALAHVDQAVIITVLTLLVVPVLAAMISAKQAETGAAVQQVKEQTNGNFTRLMEMLERANNQLAVSTPPLAPVVTLPAPVEPVDQVDEQRAA